MRVFAADELVSGVNLQGDHPRQRVESVWRSTEAWTYEHLVLLGAERNRDSGRLAASFAAERGGLPAEDARLFLILSSQLCKDLDGVRSWLDDDGEGQ